MARLRKWAGGAGVVFVLLLAAAQSGRLGRARPPAKPSQTIAASLTPGASVLAVFDGACTDRHSNATRWSWAERITPLSWLIAQTVPAGHKALNFSKRGSYTPARRAALPTASCNETAEGKMPGAVWTLFHPEARLSGPDIEVICAAAREAWMEAAMTAANTMPLEARVEDFLAQKRIAVAGVSHQHNLHPAANLIYRRLKDEGHDVFPVNPNLDAFEGQRCWPDVGSIPGGVDGVVIVTRPEITDKIVRDCAAAGIRRVWMHQSTRKGTSVSPEAVEKCADNGITVIPGGCPMMYVQGVDLGHRCMRWFLQITGGLPA